MSAFVADLLAQHAVLISRLWSRLYVFSSVTLLWFARRFGVMWSSSNDMSIATLVHDALPELSRHQRMDGYEERRRHALQDNEA